MDKKGNKFSHQLKNMKLEKLWVISLQKRFYFIFFFLERPFQFIFLFSINPFELIYFYINMKILYILYIHD